MRNCSIVRLFGLVAGGVVCSAFGANDLPESMDGGSTYGFWATPLVLKGEKKPVDEKNPMKDLEKRRDWAEMYRRADDSTEGLGWRYGAALCLARDELVDETLAKLRAKPLDDALVDAYLNAARIIGRFLYYTGHLAVEPTLRPLLAAHETDFTPGQQFKVQNALLGAYDKGRDYARAAECFRKLQALPKANLAGITYHHAGALIRHRAFREALPLVEAQVKARYRLADNVLRLAGVQLALGMDREAAATVANTVTNLKVKAEVRFAAQVVRLIAQRKDAAGFAADLRALRGEMSEKDFFNALRFTSRQLMEPLMTEGPDLYLRTLVAVSMDCLQPEERLVHTVKFLPSAPRTADGAETSGLFERLERETRFAKYNTYGALWKNDERKRLKDAAPVSLGDVGEGREAALVAAYDDTGVHVYARFRDPNAKGFKYGESAGIGLEFSVMPGEDTSYWQTFFNSGSVIDRQEVEWNGPGFGEPLRAAALLADAATHDDCYVFHFFVPWTAVYTRLPKDGDTWNTVLVVNWGKGLYSLGGGCVHEFGRGMKLKFEISGETAAAIRRALVRRAAGDYLRFRAPWENTDLWDDPHLGDRRFAAEVVKPWTEAEDAAAKRAIREIGLSDEEISKIAAEHLRAWLDPRLTLDAKRAAWLESEFFGKGDGI